MKERIDLTVPANVRTKQELINGFGFSELFKALLITGISVIIALIVHSLSPSGDIFLPVGIVILSASSAFFALKKNDLNQSMVTFVMNYIRFAKSQKRYEYVYINPFDGKEKY